MRKTRWGWGETGQNRRPLLMFAYSIGEHEQGSSVEVINFLKIVHSPLFFREIVEIERVLPLMAAILIFSRTESNGKIGDCEQPKTLFTWRGGPRSSGVGFFCFVSPRA